MTGKKRNQRKRRDPGTTRPRRKTCELKDCRRLRRPEWGAGGRFCSRGCRNIGWIEARCFVPDGENVGQPVELRPWQRHDLRKIYNNPHRTRLAIISFAKKNGKTALAAFLLLLHLVGPEALRNTQLPSTGQSREQAGILFSLAAKVVRMSRMLTSDIVIREHEKQLYCPELGTLYRALSADASTAHGQSPVFAVHDELGQVRGPTSPLFNAIENAMGAHAAPLSIVISTQAPTDADLLSTLIDEALTGADPRTVLSLYTADPDLDPFSVEAIKQANPAYGDFLNAEEIQAQAKRAERMPAYEPDYRNYQLNQRVEAKAPFVTQTTWKANGGEPRFGTAWYGGLDLSEVNDLTALLLISYAADGTWGCDPFFWLPEDGIVERARRDRVPYDIWAEQGFIELTPGRSIEYSWVARRIATLFAERDIRKIAFDRFNMRHLRPWLQAAELSEAFIDDRFVEFGQGFYSMSPALRHIESLLLNHRMRHGMHPVLRMCAANAVVKRNEAGDRKLDKAKSSGRIDGMVALTMAAEVANANQAEGGTVLKPEWLKCWQKEPSGGNRYIVMAGPHDKKPHPEITTIWVVELREDRNYYVIELIRGRYDLAVRTSLLLDLHRDHKPLRVGYEKRSLEADLGHIKDRQARENYRFGIDELGGQLTEHERIMRLVPLFQAERILLPEKYELDGVEMVDVFRRDEYLPYPVGFHADMLDTLSRILDMRTVFPSEHAAKPPPAVFPSDFA